MARRLWQDARIKGRLCRSSCSPALGSPLCLRLRGGTRWWFQADPTSDPCRPRRARRMTSLLVSSNTSWPLRACRTTCSTTRRWRARRSTSRHAGRAGICRQQPGLYGRRPPRPQHRGATRGAIRRSTPVRDRRTLRLFERCPGRKRQRHRRGRRPGVGTALEALAAPAHRLRLVLFVNEEPPYYRTPDMGSWRYAKPLSERGEKVRGMISLETLGCLLRHAGLAEISGPVQLDLPVDGQLRRIRGPAGLAQLPA